MNELVRRWLEQVEQLDERIQENWRLISMPSTGGRDIALLYVDTEMLMTVRAFLKQMLREKFDIIII